MNVTIGKITYQELGEMYDEVVNSRESLEVLGWLEDTDRNTFITHYVGFIGNPEYDLYSIRLDDKFVGAIEIAHYEEHYYIGFWLGSSYRSRGIMAQALTLLRGVFTDKPFYAQVEHNNTHSRHLLQKLGYKIVSTDPVYTNFQYS